MKEQMDNFHKHLDGCKQCADHPFALCMTGAMLLEQAAKAALPKGYMRVLTGQWEAGDLTWQDGNWVPATGKTGAITRSDLAARSQAALFRDWKK